MSGTGNLDVLMVVPIELKKGDVGCNLDVKSSLGSSLSPGAYMGGEVDVGVKDMGRILDMGLMGDVVVR